MNNGLPTLAWLVAMLLSTGTSGTPQPDTASAEFDSSTVDPAITERKNIAVLVKLLQNECLSAAKYNRTQSFHNYLITTLGAKEASSLYNAAIAQLLDKQPSEAVAAYVWHIHRRDGAATYALMAEMQFLMWNYRFFQVDIFSTLDPYWNDLAYYLYNIRNNVFFDALDPVLKNGLEFAIKSLTSALQRFYFAPQFCLVNRHYFDDSAYCSTFVEDGRRQIYAKDKNKRNALHVWQKHVVDTPVDGVAIKGRANFAVSLRSRDCANYIYLDRTKKNRIFGWPNGNEVDGSFWRVHFVHLDTLMFEQQGHYMCASDALADQGRGRYIDAIAGNSSMMYNAKCRWEIETC